MGNILFGISNELAAIHRNSITADIANICRITNITCKYLGYRYMIPQVHDTSSVYDTLSKIMCKYLQLSAITAELQITAIQKKSMKNQL